MEDYRTDQSGASKPDTTPTSKAASQQAFAACRAVLESEVPLSPAEQAEHRRRLEPPRCPPDPSLTPTQRWDRAPQAEATHPYLKAKGIRPHGARREGDHLLIPIRRGTELIGLQTVAPDGTQRFLDGADLAGGYCAIGKPKGLLCIAIGFAAGASIHEATGHAVAVAFSADNLAAVASGLRERLPAISLVVCADTGSDSNAQPKEATAAANAVGGVVAVPDFGADQPKGATGFGDLRHLRANGPMLQAEATKRGEEVGISARTLRRASEKLKVDRRKLSFSKGWEWSLPTEATQAFQGVQDAQGAPTRPRADGGRLGHPADGPRG